MRICDLNSGMGQLGQALADLKHRWAETKTQWNDAASKQFEKAHLLELPQHLQQVVGAAQRLTEIIEKAQRECDDEAVSE